MPPPEPFYEDELVTIYNADCRGLIEQLDYDVVVTDPPYGMSFDSNMKGRFGRCTIANDDTTDLRDYVVKVNDGCPMLMFGSPIIERPVGHRAVLIWDKGDSPGMGDLRFPWGRTYEEIYVYGTGWSGKRRGCVYRHNRVSNAGSARTHPTEKPVQLLTDLIAYAPHGVLLDPFMGTGSTLVAAKQLGRKAIGVELDERYCEIAAQRLAGTDAHSTGLLQPGA